VLLLLAAAALALALVACGGGDDEDSGDAGAGSQAEGTTTAAATTNAAATATTAGNGSDGTPAASGNTGEDDDIAHNAMISETDLPGTGWTVVSTDEFGDSLLDADETDFSDIEACQQYVDQIRDAAETADAVRTGRASKSFQRTDDLLGSSVDIEVNVYENGDAAKDLISNAKNAFDSSDFQECFREIFKGSEGEIPEDIQFELNTTDPLSDAPHDGVAQAFDLKLSAAGQTFSLHAEFYAWADDRATAFVSVLGTPDSMDAEVVQAAVGKTDEKLSDAQ